MNESNLAGGGYADNDASSWESSLLYGFDDTDDGWSCVYDSKVSDKCLRRHYHDTAKELDEELYKNSKDVDFSEYVAVLTKNWNSYVVEAKTWGKLLEISTDDGICLSASLYQPDHKREQLNSSIRSGFEIGSKLGLAFIDRLTRSGVNRKAVSKEMMLEELRVAEEVQPKDNLFIDAIIKLSGDGMGRIGDDTAKVVTAWLDMYKQDHAFAGDYVDHALMGFGLVVELEARARETRKKSYASIGT